ncbi:MAG: hypothetical protein II793_00305 [Bacteroidales bacterium]|nr:hypothetical protein [Bacteroidales bacterium]
MRCESEVYFYKAIEHSHYEYIVQCEYLFEFMPPVVLHTFDIGRQNNP